LPPRIRNRAQAGKSPAYRRACSSGAKTQHSLHCGIETDRDGAYRVGGGL
jgi:hypothetical protein